MRRVAARGRAFTLVELIVMVVISGILVAVGAFAYASVLSSARDSGDQARAEQVSREIKGAAMVQKVDLGQVATTTDRGVEATTVSNGIKASLGVSSEDTFVTPLAPGGALPARLQIRDGSSYTCLTAATGATTAGPCPMLVNASFEAPFVNGRHDGADHIEGYYNSAVARDTTQSRTGNASARVALNNSANESGVYVIPQRGLLLPPGTQTRAGAWVKAPEGVRLRVGSRVYSEAGFYLTEQQGQRTYVGTGQWQHVETDTFTYAAASHYAGMEIITTGRPTGQFMWVDDVTISIR